MARSRTSAKKAGTAFERQIADYLNRWVDDRIDRQAKTGAKDIGDITPFRHMGGKIIIECKNTSRLALADWADQADIERGNADGMVGVICHKRHGNARPEDQWITMTLGEFVALITGSRDHY